MLLLPLSTDVKQSQPPVANVLLVVSTVAVFLMTSPWSEIGHHRLALSGWSPQSLVGHLWLHADFFHIFGNMLFLWVFGNAVCSRVGNLAYPVLYVGLGVAAGAAHLLTADEGIPAVGASGAINGVVGMFAVLFPESRVRILWVFFWTWGRIWAVPSGLLIALWFILDLWGATRDPVGIAYWAHIGGFVAGFSVAVLFLTSGWVKLYSGEKTLMHMTGWSPPAPPAPKREAWHPLPAAPKPTVAAPAAAAAPAPPAPPMITFRCTCGTVLKCPEDQGGSYIKCDRCGNHARAPRRERRKE